MKQNISVLIVEDNLDDYSLLREVLESSEEVAAVIFHEERLESALSAAKNKAIDVAVIDLSLPDSFGLDTFISFHDKYPLIPTIIMTGTKDYEIAFIAVRMELRIIFLRESLRPPPSSELFATPSNVSA